MANRKGACKRGGAKRVKIAKRYGGTRCGCHTGGGGFKFTKKSACGLKTKKKR